MKDIFVGIWMLFCVACHGTPVKTVTVLFLGDSLTEGYGVARGKNYPSLLERRLKGEKISIKVINGSISGSTTASGLSRYRWFKKADPDMVVVALGANDALRGIDPKISRQHLEQLIKAIVADKKKILLIGMKAPPNYGTQFGKEFEKIFSSLAQKYKLVLVPFLLEGVAGEKKLNQADGIHPNQKGHQIMMKTVYPHLKGLL